MRCKIDQEVPIPEPEPSPFDTQNTIEQAICDLTERQRLSVTQCDECNRALMVTHACFAMSSQEGMEIKEERFPIFRGKVRQEEGMIEANCYECKKGIWIPDQYCRRNAPHEITAEPDKAREGPTREEQFIRSNLGGSGITYSMDYPAIVAVGVVLPQIYRGKSGMPSVDLWQHHSHGHYGRIIHAIRDSRPTQIASDKLFFSYSTYYSLVLLGRYFVWSIASAVLVWYPYPFFALITVGLNRSFLLPRLAPKYGKSLLLDFHSFLT